MSEGLNAAERGWLRRLLDRSGKGSWEQGDSQTEIDCQIQLYDHDFFPLEEAFAKIPTAVVGANFTQARRIIEEIFQEKGFAVKAMMWTTQYPNRFIPEVTIVGRVERQAEFDHERQAHEVQHGLLGIDEPGAITLKGGLKTPSKSTLFTKKD